MQKHKYLKIVNMEIPIYYGKLIVVVSTDFNETIKSLKFPIDYDMSGCYGFASKGQNKQGKTERIIFLGYKPTHSIIAHEALHTTHGILDDVNIHADYINDEAACYLHDWIIEQVYTGLAKHKIKVYIKNID